MLHFKDWSIIAPVISLANKNISFKKGEIFASAYSCKEDVGCNEPISRINAIGALPKLQRKKVIVGPFSKEQKQK